jgi:hypothetical protein
MSQKTEGFIPAGLCPIFVITPLPMDLVEITPDDVPLVSADVNPGVTTDVTTGITTDVNPGVTTTGESIEQFYNNKYKLNDEDVEPFILSIFEKGEEITQNTIEQYFEENPDAKPICIRYFERLLSISERTIKRIFQNEKLTYISLYSILTNEWGIFKNTKYISQPGNCHYPEYDNSTIEKVLNEEYINLVEIGIVKKFSNVVSNMGGNVDELIEEVRQGRLIIENTGFKLSESENMSIINRLLNYINNPPPQQTSHSRSPPQQTPQPQTPQPQTPQPQTPQPQTPQTPQQNPELEKLRRRLENINRMLSNNNITSIRRNKLRRRRRNIKRRIKQLESFEGFGEVTINTDLFMYIPLLVLLIILLVLFLQQRQ